MPTTASTEASIPTTTKTPLEIPEATVKLLEKDSPLNDPLDYVTDEELQEEKAVRIAKNPRQSLRLVKIRNFVDADAEKRLPARDFTGQAPRAKPDLRGFGVSLLFI